MTEWRAIVGFCCGIRGEKDFPIFIVIGEKCNFENKIRWTRLLLSLNHCSVVRSVECEIL